MPAKAPNPIFGTITCCTPGCGAVCKLRIADQGEGFVYYVCTECSSQHFARGPRSDSLMRKACKPLPAASPPAAPPPPPSPAPEKKPEVKNEKQKPAPVAKPAAAATGERRRGLLDF